MPTTQRSKADGEAAADTAPVADAPAPVEDAAPAAAPVAEEVTPAPPHPDELWQSEPRVRLMYVGAEPKVCIPFGEVHYGDTGGVPESLVASYLKSKDFVPAAD